MVYRYSIEPQGLSANSSSRRSDPGCSEKVHNRPRAQLLKPDASLSNLSKILQTCTLGAAGGDTQNLSPHITDTVAKPSPARAQVTAAGDGRRASSHGLIDSKAGKNRRLSRSKDVRCSTAGLRSSAARGPRHWPSCAPRHCEPARLGSRWGLP
jgi:hypothetical protein